MLNECLNIPKLKEQITLELEILPEYAFTIICIDDGSVDGTLEALTLWRETDQRLQIIELSRNFGKEAALTCGLDHAIGDALIIIDADLQDPVSLISELIQKWEETSADIVLARRSNRETDSYLKRTSANWFYYAVNLMAPIKIPVNVGDTRLMTSRVATTIKQLPERRRFMKGLMSWVGFQLEHVDFVRSPRKKGVSNFPFWKLWNFALDGIVAHSSILLRIWVYIGFVGIILAIILMTRVLYFYLIGANETPGYPSIMITMLFFGSLQLFCLGIFGEYISRIYQEVQQRPIYLIKKIHGVDVIEAK